MALQTAAEYVAAARVNLNDTVAPFRYADTTLYQAIELAYYEISNMRPDLTLDLVLQDQIVPGSQINLERGYRSALLDYICGYAEQQDVESADASRSAMYMASFKTKLMKG